MRSAGRSPSGFSRFGAAARSAFFLRFSFDLRGFDPSGTSTQRPTFDPVLGATQRYRLPRCHVSLDCDLHADSAQAKIRQTATAGNFMGAKESFPEKNRKNEPAAARAFHIAARNGGTYYPRSMKISQIARLATGAAVLVLLSSCTELQTAANRTAQAVSAALPTPEDVGYWHDDGASGSPKIVVNLGEQRAYFWRGKRLVGESTVSTGKPGFSTPPGHYRVISKDKDHVSSAFGDYVDDAGNVVKSNIDSRKDARPKGTHFDGARMPYCMHFNGGYAMHAGFVPRYRASHGCIRLPAQMAEHFFNAAREGTPVIVKE